MSGDRDTGDFESSVLAYLLLLVVALGGCMVGWTVRGERDAAACGSSR